MIAAPAHPRSLVFLGTPDPAVGPLRALHAAGFPITLVVSRADKRRGRRAEPTPSPVKAAALELGLPVTTEVDAVLDVDADLGVVVAFGRIIKPHVLDRLAMVNLHFSLLPRWRGAAPVERALLAGDTETGVCVMEVAEGLDEGGVYRRAAVPIGPRATAAELTGTLAEIGARLLVSTLQEGLGTPEPQVGPITYAAKIVTDDLALDWSADAEQVDRVVRVGGAYTGFRGKRLKVWSALPRPDESTRGEPGSIHGALVTTGRGAVELIEVQPEGRERVSAASWLNGARPGPDERLGP